jgi:hypothetical protein
VPIIWPVKELFIAGQHIHKAEEGRFASVKGPGGASSAGD